MTSEYHKQYFEKYYKEHKQYFLDYCKVKIECPVCKKMISRCHMAKHKRTTRHIEKENALKVIDEVKGPSDSKTIECVLKVLKVLHNRS